MTVYFIDDTLDRIVAVKHFDEDPESNTFDYKCRLTLRDYCKTNGVRDAYISNMTRTVDDGYVVLFRPLPASKSAAFEYYMSKKEDDK